MVTTDQKSGKNVDLGRRSWTEKWAAGHAYRRWEDGWLTDYHLCPYQHEVVEFRKKICKCQSWVKWVVDMTWHQIIITQQSNAQQMPEGGGWLLGISLVLSRGFWFKTVLQKVKIPAALAPPFPPPTPPKRKVKTCSSWHFTKLQTLNALFPPHPVNNSFASLWNINIRGNKPNSFLIEFKICYRFANFQSFRLVRRQYVDPIFSDFALRSFFGRLERHGNKS